MSRTPTPLRLALVKAGRTQRDVAAAVGLNEPAFSRIVNGLHADDRTRAAIAAELGTTVEILWPEPAAA